MVRPARVCEIHENAESDASENVTYRSCFGESILEPVKICELYITESLWPVVPVAYDLDRLCLEGDLSTNLD